MLVPLDRSVSKDSRNGQDLHPKPDYPLSVAVLGSTGSIGKSTLDVVRSQPDKFKVVALVAGTNTKELWKQAEEFQAKFVAVGDEDRISELELQKESCNKNWDCEISAGPDAISKIAQAPQVDVVLAAIVGMAGLPGVLAAVEAGKTICLANKESLVAAGACVSKLAALSSARIVPVDSEHSAIFQALVGNKLSDVERIVLTASGGPFLKHDVSELRNVTPLEAVQHPNWSMGAKISIDSATMMNKALEVIEAYWLFGIEADRIDVLIHPQSIVHSLVEFVDQSQIAQLSVPDMKGAISYALHFPFGRLASGVKPLRLEQINDLEFIELDNQRFPAIALAKACVKAGGVLPAVMNTANEVAVSAFMSNALSFDRIVPFVEEALEFEQGKDYQDASELFKLDCELRERLMSKLNMPSSHQSMLV